MSSQEIRRQFLKFFKDQGHTVVPSSPVVPMGDPTLLFINAGMNQFKDVFLGKSVRDYSRAASSQKCIRVGGKHNDLENVGHTSRHLTFFEMLGNFSFGDYFKKQAIAYAWDLTLNVFQFEKEKIWATVFHEDQEAFDLWRAFLPAERIIRMGEKDNFWAMGDTGPCGPCSELYYDRGEKYSQARSPAEDIEGVRYLEFWNLVFMEFNRGKGGELHKLPKQSVDTGAGLERVLSLKMGTDSLFETDILGTLIKKVEEISGQPYRIGDLKCAAFRVIADHTRSLAFAIADGVVPSNIDRGYVLRKVLRRAVRYGRQLNLEKPFLAEVIPTLAQSMGEDFPELRLNQDRIASMIMQEEESFHRTLRRGGNLLNQIMAEATQTGVISGEEAFKLKDTYGLPLEEILLLAKDGGLGVDIQRFEDLEHEARERSRGSRKTTDHIIETSVYSLYSDTHGPSQFLGYGQLTAESVVLGLIREGKEVAALHQGEEGVVLLDQTPFYAEKGGQVGDQGALSSTQGTFDVIDCQTPFTDIIAHHGIVKEGEIHVGDRVYAVVDALRRKKIACNHSATHLLHWALRLIIGPHIKQAGSVVEANKLRFDFNHHKALTPEKLSALEDQVNAQIRENRPIHSYELPYTDVQSRADIIQFFGDKYGTVVRVVDFDISKELCGGTHTASTGSIGYFRILKEGSIAAGVRRIEAVTGEEAEAYSRVEKKALMEQFEQKAQENKLLQADLNQLKRTLLKTQAQEFLSQRQILGPHKIPFLATVCALNGEDLKECADWIMKQSTSLVLLLIGKEGSKCTLIVRVSSDLIQRGIKAVDLLKEVTPLIGGKGGGKSDAAQGGGDIQHIETAVQHAKQWLEQRDI